MEAKAIQYALDKVDIFTGSWGPLDNGLVVDGPGKLASLALENGILKVSEKSNWSSTLP